MLQGKIKEQGPPDVNVNDGNPDQTTTAGTVFAPLNLDKTAAPPGDAGAESLFGPAVALIGAGVCFVDEL